MTDLREIAARAISAQYWFNPADPTSKDLEREGSYRYAEAVIAAIEPVLRTRHRAELYAELAVELDDLSNNARSRKVPIATAAYGSLSRMYTKRARQEAETDGQG